MVLSTGRSAASAHHPRLPPFFYFFFGFISATSLTTPVCRECVRVGRSVGAIALLHRKWLKRTHKLVKLKIWNKVSIRHSYTIVNFHTNSSRDQVHICWKPRTYFNVEFHPKTLFEIAMALLTIRVSFPSKSRCLVTFSILLRFGESWNPKSCEKFNADGSLMGRTNLDKSVW